MLEALAAKELAKELGKQPDILKGATVDRTVDIYKPLVGSFKDTHTVQCILPDKNGMWEGEKGDGTWKPDPDSIPKKPSDNERTWREILEPYGTEGIEFKDGEPDFTPVSEASVEIEDFGLERDDNFTQADEALAKKWSEEQKDGKDWTAKDVEQYRKEHKLSWHERSDQKTMDLVPQVIHGNIPHSGGISAAKKSQGESNA
ncbi:MAG: HNH endonuclease [Wolinella sp.]